MDRLFSRKHLPGCAGFHLAQQLKQAVFDLVHHDRQRFDFRRNVNRLRTAGVTTAAPGAVLGPAHRIGDSFAVKLEDFAIGKPRFRHNHFIAERQQFRDVHAVRAGHAVVAVAADDEFQTKKSGGRPIQRRQFSF